MRDFLALHTIDLLPVSADVKSEMHRFGLHTMGAVVSMSGHVLTRSVRTRRQAGLGTLQRH